MIHTAESATDFLGANPGVKAMARYFATTDRFARYHHLSESDSSIHLATWSAETWHDTGANNHSVGFSAAIQWKDWKNLGARGELIVKRIAAGAASYAKWLKQGRGITIPARRIIRSQARDKIPGFLGHATSDPGRRSDPCTDFDWDLFFSEYKRFMDTTIPDVKPAGNPSAPATLKPAGKSVVQMAAELLAGQHGTGHDTHRKSPGVSAATFANVRDESSCCTGGKTLARLAGWLAGKNITQMANEATAGKHSTGHPARQKFIGMNASTEAKVRAVVKQRA